VSTNIRRYQFHFQVTWFKQGFFSNGAGTAGCFRAEEVYKLAHIQCLFRECGLNPRSSKSIEKCGLYSRGSSWIRFGRKGGAFGVRFLIRGVVGHVEN